MKMASGYTSHKPKLAAIAGKTRVVSKPRPAKVVTREQLDKAAAARNTGAPAKVPETGGPAGPEPTRYGDWEIKGRCVDF